MASPRRGAARLFCEGRSATHARLLFQPEDAARLVGRAAESVATGGRVVVKDFLAGSTAGVYFALDMALFTEVGKVREPSALEELLRAAGLRGVRTAPLRSAPDAVVVVGTK